MLTCTKCKAEKPETEFHACKTTVTRRRPECKTCRKTERRARYEANREKEAAQMLAYRQVEANQQSARRRAREQKAVARQDPAYRKRETAFNREWRRRNPEKMAAANARQRARGRFSPDWTPEEWAALLDLYGHRCLACLTTGVRLQPDHVVPLSWPGASNAIDNIQPLCGPCNLTKSDKHIDYRPELKGTPS
ncbi:hypothetical protein GCM10010387_15730 [Streptomyces inusitatus]|uniref:HNH nuclease domain-containing protein n=1 Tax=Streptomyces inusitatus TaxID=68221 RepID=A0A918PVC5_9ACTN|nr:HNH endonuclease signature motif containing protein [Streptomyces inusitatus]GGZ23421.1 hypothetical protein GCM10010387_15730 [Streptomyces inusitatus]